MNAERTLSKPITTGLRSPNGLFRYSIAYDPAVLEAIRGEATRESADGASEAGKTYGLLWGTHEETKVEILACSPLSLPDLPLVASLRRALFKAGGTAGLIPLGFYRIVDEGETTFSQDEARALAELFPEPWQFVMVLCLAGDRPPKIRLFFHLNNGSIGTDSSMFELPVSRGDVEDTRGGGFPSDYLEEREGSRDLVKFRRPARARLAFWRWRLWPQALWFLVGIAVVGAATEFRIWNLYNPGLTAPASEQSARGNKDLPDTAAFPLQADIRESKPGAVIRLRWNPLATVIRNSPVGILSVSDGSMSRELVFKRRELDLGYTDYPAASDEITFRLMVEAAGEPKQESLLVLLGGRDGGPGGSKLSPQPDSREASRASLNFGSQRSIDQTGLAKQVEVAPTGGVRDPVLNPSAAPGIPQQVSPLASSTAGQLGIQQMPVAPPPPGPSNTAQPKLASQPRLEFVAPAVVRRVPPILPYSVQRLAVDDLRIKVRVDIDANGRVTACSPVSAPSGVNKYLAAVARDTVMQWRFSPGRLGGKPVASETVLDLDFSNVH